MAETTDSPPRPTRKAAQLNAHPGQRYHPSVRRSSEQVRAAKEEEAAKKAITDKRVADAQNNTLRSLAALNDELTNEDKTYSQQSAAPKKVNKSRAVTAQQIKKKKATTDPLLLHRDRRYPGLHKKGKLLKAGSTKNHKGDKGERKEGGAPEGLAKSAEQVSADQAPTSRSLRRVQELSQVLTSRTGSAKSAEQASADQVPTSRPLHRVQEPSLVTSRTTAVTVDSEPRAEAEAESGVSSGSEFEPEKPSHKGTEVSETTDDESVVDESDPEGTTNKPKTKRKRKVAARSEQVTRAAKKPKCSQSRPVREAIQALQKNPTPVMVTKRKVAPEVPVTDGPVASKRVKPVIAQGIDRDWMKDNVSKGSSRKGSADTTETGASSTGLGGLQDESLEATAASRDAKANMITGKGGRTIAAMGLKATVAPDTDVAVKKEAEAVKPLRMQGMEDIPFRSLDEYRIFDTAVITAALDWAGAADNPFGTNEHPQINKILQKIWDELLPDNPLDITNCLAVKKVVADRFNNYRSGIGKAGRTVVAEHLQSKRQIDPNLDIQNYAKIMAPRTKPFLYLYKDSEVGTGPYLTLVATETSELALGTTQARTGAFESELVLKVFAAHLKRVASSPLDFHVGHPVGALALAAVSVECAFKEYQQAQAALDDKGIAFGSNEWGNSAVGWTAYLRKFDDRKWARILGAAGEFATKSSRRFAIDFLQAPVDEYEERATMAVSDQEDADGDEVERAPSDDGARQRSYSAIVGADDELANWELGQSDDECPEDMETRMDELAGVEGDDGAANSSNQRESPCAIPMPVNKVDDDVLECSEGEY
ncbi:hypothetical protein K488DRAFT_68349 [Vararia minispora EC-137]|uniref:Uncharacterized protein n=1 Tax=Vararia minispora EC-137 TaxID=1314806 RepID=A0ACB8QVT4_9AGAM|nr:hypothetical protein K488DRAFT_68349 [Vararia minispora EC-137]